MKIRTTLAAVILALVLYSCVTQAQQEEGRVVASPYLQTILDKLIKVSNKANDADKAKAYINLTSKWFTAITWRDRSIVFHQGLMEQTDNDDELALIMGHELAHILEGHLGPFKALGPEEEDKSNAREELECDVLGAVLMYRAGFDCDNGANIWKKFIHINGDVTGPGYPLPSDRYKRIKQVCEAQKIINPR